MDWDETFWIQKGHLGITGALWIAGYYYVKKLLKKIETSVTKEELKDYFAGIQADRKAWQDDSLKALEKLDKSVEDLRDDVKRDLGSLSNKLDERLDHVNDRVDDLLSRHDKK